MNSSSLRVPRFLALKRAHKLKDFKTRGTWTIASILLLGVLAASPNSSSKNWTDLTLKNLSLRDKIAQLIQIRVPGRFLNNQSELFLKIREQIQKNHVGGVVLFAGNVYESAVLLNHLQSISKLPLLVAADFERGAAFRIEDTTSFPWTMALGATGSEEFAFQQGRITAQESRALGVHWIFAPVMDVNNNPANPVINIRSFGEDPALVSRLGAAFIRGAKTGGVLTTAKHFPGHGDTATDSHLSLAVVQSDMARLKSLEFLPFMSAIEAGVDSVMTAHVAVPKVTGDEQAPATLSPGILKDLLRDSLHFKGLVVTDALEMGGITNSYWCGLAAIRAIQAGADILLLPPDATVAINEVERAVHRGDILEERIDESVRKVLEAKRRMGLAQKRLAAISDIARVIASPQHVQLAQDIADRSITVPIDEQRLLPLDPTGYPRIFSLALSPDLDSSPADIFQKEMRQRFPMIKTTWVNARISEEILDAIEKSVSESEIIVCSTLIRQVSGPNAAYLPPGQRLIFDKLVESHKPIIWVAFGNPYVFSLAPRIGTYLCTFSISDVSQIAAAKAISGQIEIAGRMPVTIPDYFKVGDGRTIPKLEMALKPLSPEKRDLLKIDPTETNNVLNSFIEAGTFPGAVLLAAHQGTIVLDLAAGRTAFAGGSPEVTTETLYEIGSLSNYVGILPGIMMAADSGNLLLDAPVLDYVPEIGTKAVGRLRLRELFGSSNGEDLLKTILSRTTGIEYQRFLTEHFWTPLGMVNTFWRRPKSFSGTVAKSLNAENTGILSSAHDLAIFSQTLLNLGVYNHNRYFKLNTAASFLGSQGRWIKPSDSDWTGKVFSRAAFGFNDASGSLLWIDPDKKLVVVFLANGLPGAEQVLEAQGKICESVIATVSN